MADVLINFRARNETRSEFRELKGDIQSLEIALRAVADLARVGIRLAGDLRRAESERLESISELESDTSERIASINERKAERLGDISRRIEAEDRRRLAEIEQAFEDARDAEVEARAEAGAAIVAIEARVVRQRLDAQQQYYREVASLETELVEDIARIRDGYVEREAGRQAEIVEITERAAAGRISAELRYQERVTEINRGLVETVIGLRADLAERLGALDAGLLAREASRADALVVIEVNAAEARVAAQGRYRDTVIEINRGLVLEVQRLQADLGRDLEALTAGLVEREASRAGRLVAIEQDAVAARFGVQVSYQERVLAINRDLVNRVQDLQTGLTETLSSINSDFLAREASRADALVALERETVERRVGAQAVYSERIDAINRSLVNDVRAIQSDIRRIESDAAEARSDIISEAVDARRDAESTYSERVQGIYNDLAGEIERIEVGLTNRLDSIRDRRLSAETDRIQALSRLNRETGETVSDRRLGLGRDIQDVLSAGGLGREDLSASRLGDIFGQQDFSDASRLLGTFDADVLSEIEVLRREYFRDLSDIERETGRERVAIAEASAGRQSDLDAEALEARTAASTARAGAEVGAGVDAETALANAVPALDAMTAAALAFSESVAGIDAQELASLQEIEVQSSVALAESRARIAELETEAGTTFATALSNLVPEVDASTQALNELNTTLGEIARDAAERRGGIVASGISDRAVTEGRRADAISETGAAIAGLEAEAGITFEEALGNFVPEVDASTQALNAFNTAIASINANLLGERAGILAEGEADRSEVAASRLALGADTAGRIAGLESRAGITFEAALADFVPEVDASTQALITFNAAIASINANLSGERSGILTTGVLDREAVSVERAEAIAGTDAAILGLEADAGISFEEALAVYTPALDASTQALADFTAALERIRTQELSGLAGVASARVSDQAAVETEIAGRRAQFDTDIINAGNRQQARLEDITLAAGQQIADVNATLEVRLGDINATLSETLAVIREDKVAFDNAIFADIREIESDAAADIAEVRSDAAIMRSEIEAIAAEARDNAWKKGLLKMANVGITIAGAAAGLVIAGPAGAVAGAQAGAVVGGLVEQAGNELFHFPETDRIAFEMAHAAGRRHRSAPDYLPTEVQLRNARDLGREVIGGFARGQQEVRETGASNASVSDRPIVIQLQLSDRTLQEIFLRGSELRSQDRLQFS